MGHNAVPAFTKNGVVGAARVTAANTSSQGGGTVGTDIFKCLTADATNGTFIEYVRFIATATTPTTTAATVGRVFVSSVTSGSTTSANTFLIGEGVLSATAADNASTNVNPVDIPINFRLPAGWAIHATTHATPTANTAWIAIAVGGDY